MNRRVLAGYPEITAPKRFAEMAKNDRLESTPSNWGGDYQRYQYDAYVQARQQDGYLMAAIYGRKELAENCRRPACTIFFDRDGKYTTRLRNGIWNDSMIINLDHAHKNLFFPWHCFYEEIGSVYISQPQRKLMQKFLGIERTNPFAMILECQKKTRRARLTKKEQKEIDEIDRWMEMVPPKPEAFMDWEDEWLYNGAYPLFYHKKKRTAFCGYCGDGFDYKAVKNKAKHNAPGICPHCGKAVTFKAWGRQKELHLFQDAVMLQKAGDMIVLRHFETMLSYVPEGGAWHKSVEEGECIRSFFDGKDLTEIRQFEYGMYKNRSHQVRWCNRVAHNYFWNGRTSPREIYTDNMPEIFKDTCLKYMQLPALIRYMNRKEKGILLNSLIREAKKRPELEYFIKAGWYAFAWALMNDFSWRRYTPAKEGSRTPWGYLGLTKEAFSSAPPNPHPDCIKTIRYAGIIHGIHVTWEQAEWIRTHAGTISLELHTYAVPTVERLIRYLDRSVLQDGMNVRSYEDYIQAAVRLRIPLTEDIRFPQHFRQAHDRMLEDLDAMKDKLKAAELAREEQKYMKLAKKLKEVYEKSDKKFMLIMPECRKDFEEEGRNMHNCVASYYKKVADGKCIVLFLRKKQDPAKSYCTVELRGSTLRQLRSACNQAPPKEAAAWMEKYTKKLQKKIEKLKDKKIRGMLLAAGQT